MDLDKEELEATRDINKNYNTDLKIIIIELCKITKAINASYLLNNDAFLIKGNRDLGNLLEDTIYYLEKQSKEIEELNYIKRCFDYCVEQEKKWEDKIKAKIEELDKQEEDLQNSISDEEREEYSDANISWKLMDIQIRREVLQSLLEKYENEVKKCFIEKAGD